MFRIIWFFLCLFVAVLLAVIGKSLFPFLISEVSPDGVSHGIYDLLSRSSVVRTAVTAGLFVLFFTLLGLGGQVLVDALTMRRFQQMLAARTRLDAPTTYRDFMQIAADAGDFAETADAYALHRTSAEREALQTKLPAAQVFDDQSQIRGRLNLWLFDNILVFSCSIGAALFLFALVAGVDEIVFQSQLSMRAPVNGLLPPLQSGLFALAIMVIVGLAARAATSYLVDLRRSQLMRFTSLLDGLFFVGQSATEALNKPLKALSDAQVLIAEDKSDQLSKALATVLTDFRDNLAGEFSKQIKSTSKLLEETEKQVTKSTVAIEAAHDALAKYARGQSAAIDKSIGAALNSYFKDETKTRAGLNTAITDSVKAASDSLTNSSKSASKALEDALERLNDSYGGGLTDTALALKQTQHEIAQLARSVELLATQRPAPIGDQREDYLRLVGEEEFADDPPPLGTLDLPDAEEGADEEQIATLTEALRGKAMKGKTRKGSKSAASKDLTSKLQDLKKGLGPTDLPEL